MPKFKSVQNRPETMEFVVATGKLLQNFGTVELLTYEWIRVLATDPMLFHLARNLKLADRVDLVKRLVEDDRFPLDPSARTSILEILANLRPLIEVRNTVAHSPVSLGFKDNDPSKVTIVRGVLNMKPKDRTKDAELISLEEINGTVNRSSSIARQLEDWLSQVEATIHEKKT